MLYKSKSVDSEARHKLMTEAPMTGLLLSMAIPTVFSQLITVIYNTADTYFVSKLNNSASAAVGVVFSLMSLIQALGFGLSMGANNIISRKLGEKKNDEAAVYANSALFATVAVGFILMAVGLPNLKWLMRILGSTETMLPYSCDYATYILIAAPVMCASFMLNNLLRAEGSAIPSMIGLCAGGILNIFLDPLFIFTFDLGISGAAIATVTGQLVSFIVLLVFYLKGKSIIKLNWRKISRRPYEYFMICKVGFPTICRQGMASIASALLNNAAGVYGDAAVAAVTIANKVYLLVRNIIIGLGQGFQPIAGYNYGAGIKKRVRRVMDLSCIIGTAFCVICAAVIALFAGEIISWFRDDPDVIFIGKKALYFACAVMPFMAYSTFVNQLYQCLGFTVSATLLASCRQGIFFIPIVLILPHYVGITGVQSVQPISDFLTFLVSIPFHVWFYKKILPVNKEK